MISNNSSLTLGVIHSAKICIFSKWYLSFNEFSLVAKYTKLSTEWFAFDINNISFWWYGLFIENIFCATPTRASAIYESFASTINFKSSLWYGLSINKSSCIAFKQYLVVSALLIISISL